MLSCGCAYLALLILLLFIFKLSVITLSTSSVSVNTKKIVGRDYSVFLAYEARNLNILGLNSRVEWEKLTSVCDYFHSPLFF